MTPLSLLNFKDRHAPENERAARRAHVAGWLLAALLTLTGSLGVSQKAAADPTRRIARAASGDFSPKGLQALTARMDPFAVELAMRHVPGAGEWTPERPAGWPVYDIETPPALIRTELSFDEAREFNALVPVSPLPNPPMKSFNLPAGGAERERALLCLTQAVYYEAGFEAGEGQRAVAQVVLNRLRHPGYPKSVCGVVYQGSQRQTGCQFSFTCDGSLQRPVAAAAWRRARDVASQALNGLVYKPVGAATHYHADYVFPYWAVTLVKLDQIGAHLFYRMTGPGGAPEAFVGRYAGGELSLPAAVLSGGDTRTPDAPSAVTPPRVVTLNIGDEARTYTIAENRSAGSPGNGAVAIGAGSGMIQPSRRIPTPDEVKRINETLRKFESEQRAPAAGVETPPQIETPAVAL